MYVLNYGLFPEPIRTLYPALEWANGHACAHQPELAAMTMVANQLMNLDEVLNK